MEGLGAASSWSRTEGGDGGSENTSDGVWPSAQHPTEKGGINLNLSVLNSSSSRSGT